MPTLLPVGGNRLSEKNNKQKTACWIMLGGGLTVIGIDVTVTTALGDLIEGDDGSRGGPIFMFTGLVSRVAFHNRRQKQNKGGRNCFL